MIPFACENPQRIVLPSGRTMSVPCGHCNCCLSQKGLQRSTLLSSATAHYKFRYFVTLTYNNEHLPIAKLCDGILFHPNDCDYNGVVYNLPISLCPEDNSFISSNIVKFGGLPVLSHRDIINFKKRLRKYVHSLCNLNYQPYENLFLYVVGEYGPTTYRPHYHGIFCTNSEFIASILKSCVLQAWSYSRKISPGNVLGSFGKIDFQRIVSKGVSDYVARYVNCSANIPCCLSKSPWKPFTQKPGLRGITFNLPDESLRQILLGSITQIPFVSPVDGSVSTIKLPSNVESRLFPKPVGFALVDATGLYSLYRFALRIGKRDIGNYYDYLRNGFLSAYDRFIYKIVLPYKADKVIDRFSACRALLRLWYISRRVLDNCERYSMTLSKYIALILSYYSKVELLKLRNFYELQKELLRDHSCTLPDLITLYTDTDDNLKNSSYYMRQFHVSVGQRSLNDLPPQRSFIQMSRKIIMDTTKTKKRNDYLLSVGRKRKIWLPIYSNKINKFLSN